MVKGSCQTARTGKGPTSRPYLPNFRPLTSQHILEVTVETHRRNLQRGAFYEPPSSLGAGCAPGHTHTPHSSPFSKSPCCCPWVLQGSESLYQLQNRDPRTLMAAEKQRNSEDAETEGYTVMLLCLVWEAAGMYSTAPKQGHHQESLTDHQQAANCLRPSCATGFTGIAELGYLDERGLLQQSW